MSIAAVRTVSMRNIRASRYPVQSRRWSMDDGAALDLMLEIGMIVFLNLFTVAVKQYKLSLLAVSFCLVFSVLFVSVSNLFTCNYII
jgi:hypothetical protein